MLRTVETMVSETSRLLAEVQQTVDVAQAGFAEWQELEDELDFDDAELRVVSRSPQIETPPILLESHPRFRLYS